MMNVTQDLFMNVIEKSTGAYVCLNFSDVTKTDFYPVYTNTSFEENFDLSGKDLKNVTFSSLLAKMEFDNQELLSLIKKTESTGESFSELVFSAKTKKYFNVTIFKTNGCSVSCLFFDVTVSRKNDDEKIYKYISNSSADEFQYFNNKTGYVLSSPKWYDLLGFTEKNFSKDAFLGKIHDDYRQSFIQKISRAIKAKKTTFNMEYKLNDGMTWLNHLANFKYESNDDCVEEVHYFKNITEIKEKQLELEYMAYFDTKTKTYNRKYFVDFLAAAINKAKSKNKNIELMYIDIDNFKKINDSIGFTLGDELISKFSKVLLKHESKTIKIGRICNDEFVIAIYDPNEEYSAKSVYSKIVRCLERPIRLSNGIDIYLRISVGVSKYPDAGQTADDLIKTADIAMYSVKDKDKNAMILFESSMLDEFMENVHLEHRLKEAVTKGEFYLCFQPQYDSVKNRIRGVEALIRWQDGDNGVVSPSKFIPMAEKAGYIIDIGKWVIKEALKTYAIWKHEHDFRGIISINISTIQLKDQNFPDILSYYTDINNLEPSDVEIEITESVFIGDTNATAAILKDIRNRGFRISLDDFGTGFSSLSYLKDVPIHTLKIDKTFVDSVVLDKSTNIITKAVIEMVKKLGLETIAEGVETKEQYEYLQSMNCDNIQGFFLGKPMIKPDLLEVIMRERAVHA